MSKSEPRPETTNATAKEYWSPDLQPSLDLVLVEYVQDEPNKLVAPGHVQDLSIKAMVVAVGPGRVTEFGATIHCTCNPEIKCG